MLARTDTGELAEFGYKQELERSLGSFSSFAAGFSYISILTGVFQLFFFGFASGGPAFWWTWPMVFVGQLLVAFCFAEMAARFPIAGSVYQWSKQIAPPVVSFFAGWTMIVGAIVTVAAVAVAYQVILPQVSPRFQIIGGAADVGLTNTPNGAKNAVVLALGLVVMTTVVNCIGVRLMAIINNIGVMAELIGATLLILLLAIHIRRGPDVILQTHGTGAGHQLGYFGAFLLAALMSAYVFYGFDTAGTLAEETNEPRRHAPINIIRAIATAFLIGGLLMLVAMMAVGDINAKEITTSGLPYIVKSTLGDTLGNVFLIASAVAITVCALAVHTAAIRLMFSMARDGRLPFGSVIARVSGRSKTPIVPAVTIGVATLGLLLINISNQTVFLTLTSVAIVLFYLSYLMVTLPLLLQRLRGAWPRADHGPYFTLGRWGILVNVVAVAYGVLMTINIAWPRVAVYGNAAWYFQYGAFVVVGVMALVGGAYYYAVQRHKSGEAIAEHRADSTPAEARA
ncbi:MAG: amino acid permease [Candidatus Dormibacteraeota bacterium]|nr:amino acid permease [Candidatus Dormibacteraeota bacterium]